MFEEAFLLLRVRACVRARVEREREREGCLSRARTDRECSGGQDLNAFLLSVKKTSLAPPPFFPPFFPRPKNIFTFKVISLSKIYNENSFSLFFRFGFFQLISSFYIHIA